VVVLAFGIGNKVPLGLIKERLVAVDVDVDLRIDRSSLAWLQYWVTGCTLTSQLATSEVPREWRVPVYILDGLYIQAC
jgi:hypothetical protein